MNQGIILIMASIKRIYIKDILNFYLMVINFFETFEYWIESIYLWYIFHSQPSWWPSSFTVQLMLMITKNYGSLTQTTDDKQIVIEIGIILQRFNDN